MRDIGILVWVALLFIGVVGSMISSLRRQTQVQAPQLPPEPPLPRGPVPSWMKDLVVQAPSAFPSPPHAAAPAPPPVRVVARPTPVARPVEPPHEAVAGHPAMRLRARKVFGAKRGVVRAVIAAEVLGKPRGLSDEYFRH
jgi:hypothetical protein